MISARKKFENHKATVILRSEQFFIVDWKNANGSNEYAIRYMLDIEKGNFVVTGDLGYCIASWFNRITPRKLRLFANDIPYCMDKFQAYSDMYTYFDLDVKADLAAIKSMILEGQRYSKEDIDEDFAEMECILDECDLYGRSKYPEDLTDLFDKYCENYCCDINLHTAFENLGRRISHRVILWFVGFQMACDQLGI